MSDRYIVRYRLDITTEQYGGNPEKEAEKNKGSVPAGTTKTIIGSREEVKERILHEIDHLAFKLKDLEDSSVAKERLTSEEI